jgi:hypothetical protein
LFKAFTLIFAFTMYSCGSLEKRISESNVRIYDTKMHSDYTLYFGTELNDTIIFVMKNGIACNKRKKTIDKSKLNQISELVIPDDTVFFCYTIWDVNHRYRSGSGKFAPGSNMKACIQTYSSYPYLIESCHDFD